MLYTSGATSVASASDRVRERGREKGSERGRGRYRVFRGFRTDTDTVTLSESEGVDRETGKRTVLTQY